MFWRLHLAQLLVLAIISCIVLPAAGEDLARIEGIHYKDGKPAPAKIALEYRVQDGDRPETRYFTAGTDGRFVFEDVQPGEVQVGRFVEYEEIWSGGVSPTWTSSHTIVLFARPGETHTVEIAKGAWTVQGQMVVPGDATIEVGWQAGSDRRLNTRREQPIAPPEGMTREERTAWWKEYHNSPEAQEERSQSRLYVVDIEPDGSFQVSDVQPGNYSLFINVNDTEGSFQGLGAGFLSATVDVPERAEGGVIDLGDQTIKLFTHLDPGDQAPPFSAADLDGETFSLADLAGKYVLIDFWATWCGPCVAEMPKMKALYARFGEHPDFAMVGLSVDQTKEDLATFVKEEGLSWRQGYLGPWPETDVLDHYGVQGIPAVFLIGPDGKVIAKDLRGKRVTEAVAKALGE